MNPCTCPGDPNSVPMLAQVFYLLLLLPVSDVPAPCAQGDSHGSWGYRDSARWRHRQTWKVKAGVPNGQRSAHIVPVTAMLTPARDTRSPRKGLKTWHTGKRLASEQLHTQPVLTYASEAGG